MEKSSLANGDKSAISATPNVPNLDTAADFKIVQMTMRDAD